VLCPLSVALLAPFSLLAEMLDKPRFTAISNFRVIRAGVG
jgi:hypothetical protein